MNIYIFCFLPQGLLPFTSKVMESIIASNVKSFLFSNCLTSNRWIASQSLNSGHGYDHQQYFEALNVIQDVRTVSLEIYLWHLTKSHILLCLPSPLPVEYKSAFIPGFLISSTHLIDLDCCCWFIPFLFVPTVAPLSPHCLFTVRQFALP